MIAAYRAGEQSPTVSIKQDEHGTADRLTVLSDPRGAIPPYDAVILVSPRRAADKRFLDALRPLVGAIGVEAMRAANYSVDRDLVFQTLRVQIPETAARRPSISGVYWCAFLYENEIHDLYGITFDGLVLDFKGTLYKTAIPAPFAVKPETPGVSASVVQPRV